MFQPFRVALFAVAAAAAIQAQAAQSSVIQIAGLPNEVKPGQTVQMTIRLAELFSGEPVTGVNIFVGVGDRFSAYEARYSTGNGSVRVTVKMPTTKGKYRIYAAFPGNGRYLYCIENRVIRVQ